MKTSSLQAFLMTSLILLRTTVSLGMSETIPANANRGEVQPVRAVYKVRSPVLAISLSAEGNILGIQFDAHRREIRVRGRTHLEEGGVFGSVIVKRLSGGGIEFVRTMTNLDNGQCLVTERFLPASDCIHWEVDIRGNSLPWSTPIITTFTWPDPETKLLWAAWQDPLASATARTTNAGPQQWHDPLIARPFLNGYWSYGIRPGGDYSRGDIITIPLVSVFLPNAHRSLTLVQSPEDVLLGMQLITTTNGEVSLRRTHYRIDNRHTIRLRMDLVPGADDWRAVMGWIVRRYSRFFEPPNPNVQPMAGTGAYSGSEKPVDVKRLKRMAFRILWKLSDDYAYMGMFLPPFTNADTRWERVNDVLDQPGYKPSWTSFRRLNDFACYLKTNGFYLLSYFNATEFGRNMKHVAVSPAEKHNPNLWKNPSGCLQARMPNAPIKPLTRCWQNGWLVDPGDPAYMDFLLEQAKRHLRWVPDAAGICIDRADHLRLYNLGADDGASWAAGQKARALVISWRRFMDRLGPLMHRKGKVIFCNLMDQRLELARHLDGIYLEYPPEPNVINGIALICVDKPLLRWTRDKDLLDDALFQRYLYLGVFPTAPYPFNNHCIQPSPAHDRWYLDYGPLFDALRGKQWVLTAHCIEVVGHVAKANLFRVLDGWAAPVMLGGTNATAVVKICGVSGLTAGSRCKVLHPGSEKTLSVPMTWKHGEATVRVPLVRGCAMLQIFPNRINDHK
jgi:hypothetical protein